jgi:hypothetical protein
MTQEMTAQSLLSAQPMCRTFLHHITARPKWQQKAVRPQTAFPSGHGGKEISRCVGKHSVFFV